MIRAVILALMAALPGLLSPPAGASELAADDRRLELARLADVRERLERRRALHRDLQVQIDALTAEIEALGLRQDEASTALRSERERARVVERRLDRVVPRLLARAAEAAQRRAQAAGVLADFARKTRAVRLDPRIRARMLALTPLLLERLPLDEEEVGSPHARPDRVLAHQAQIERSLAELTGAEQRLEQERKQKRRLRQIASNRLRELEAEVRPLGNEQARLARRFESDRAALLARAEPPVVQRASPDLGGPRRTWGRAAAADKGSSDRRRREAPVAEVTHEAAVRARAEAPAAGPAGDAAELLVAAGWPPTPPARAHPEARRGAIAPVVPGAAGEAVEDGRSRVAALEVVFAPEGGPSGRNVRRPHGARPPPLFPVPGGAQVGALVAGGGPELAIAAAPGQAVAAPAAGRVAFAGRFKSYGLLLILEHEGEYHTLLWGFARLDVHHGDGVAVGQIVGIMDAKGDDPPVLHVERRRNGRPVDIAASSNGIQG